MHARRGQSDDDVACGDVGSRQNIRPRHGAHRKAREVIVAVLIETRHFSGLAADQSAARFLAGRRYARHHHRCDRRIEFAAGKIVEEEQRFGALHDEVVDGHCDQINADRVVAGRFDRDLDLGADTVGGGDENGIGKTGRLEIEQSAKAADLGIGARARSPAHQGLDQFHQAVTGINVDAGCRVARLVHGATKSANESESRSLPRVGRVARRLVRRNGRVRKRADAAI